jgi:hypothetical protein
MALLVSQNRRHLLVTSGKYKIHIGSSSSIVFKEQFKNNKLESALRIYKAAK